MCGCDGMGTRRAFPAEGMAAAAGAAAAAETAGAAAAAAGPIPGRPVYGGDAAKATNNAKKPFEARPWLRAGVVAAAAAAASVVRPRDFVERREGARLPFLCVPKNSRALRLLSTGGTVPCRCFSGSPCVVVFAIVAPGGAGVAIEFELMEGCGLRRNRSEGCYVGRGWPTSVRRRRGRVFGTTVGAVV